MSYKARHGVSRCPTPAISKHSTVKQLNLMALFLIPLTHSFPCRIQTVQAGPEIVVQSMEQQYQRPSSHQIYSFFAAPLLYLHTH